MSAGLAAPGVAVDRLDALRRAVARDVEQGAYDGAALIVARGGEVLLREAVGFADRAAGRQLLVDDVFYVFSVTKPMTATAVLLSVDAGDLALTTPIAEVIPEFAAAGKQRVTVQHVLTHTAGLMAGFPPVAPTEAGDLAAVVAATCAAGLDDRPGAAVRYSAIVGPAILAEVVRRLDGGGRPFRALLRERVFEPLRMEDTALGLRADLAERRVPIVVRDRTDGIFPAAALEAFNALIDEHAEIPAGGAVSTVDDVFRFAELWRRAGVGPGGRLLGAPLAALATSDHTAHLENRSLSFAEEVRGWDRSRPYTGLGFMLRGHGVTPTPMGVTSSPGTYCGIGAGSCLFWVDPQRDVTFVCLTAGLLEETRSFLRFQRLSDLVLSAVID